MNAVGNTLLIKLQNLTLPDNGIARKQAGIEEICGGTTSDANAWAALQKAKILEKGKLIVTIIIDSGLKCLNGGLYKFLFVYI